MSFHHPPPGRTLVVGPSDLGEAILSQPLFDLLRQLDPEGRIDCLASPSVAAVYRAMAEPDEVLEAPVADERLALGSRLRLARLLRSRHYDRAYVLPRAHTAAIAPWLARIPFQSDRGTGRPAPPRRLPGHQEPAQPGSMVQWFTGLVRPLPAGIDGRRAPLLNRPPALTDSSRKRLELDDGRPLFLLSPGSQYGASSRWPASHFVALASQLRGDWPSARVLTIGRAEEREIGLHVQLMSGGRIRNRIGELDLSETMGLMMEATGIIGGESPYLHLAAALRRPHVAIYGAGDPRTEPFDESRRRVLWLRQPCSPCLDVDCRFGHSACLTRLGPTAALNALRETVRIAARV